MNSQTIKRSLILYLTSEVFLSLGIGMVLYALPLLYNQSGLSDRTIGILIGSNWLVSGVAGLVLGSVADRLGASNVFKFATLLLPLAYVIAGMSHSVVMWLIATMVSGLGAALLMSTENVVLGSLLRGREMAGVFSKFVAMYTFVMGAGSIVGGYLSGAEGFRVTVLTGAAIALVAPMIRVFVRAPDTKSKHLFRMPSRRILAMSMFAMLFGLATGLLGPFTTLILKGTFGFSDAWTGIVSACATFAMTIGSFMVTGLLRRFQHRKTLAISFALGILFTWSMMWTGIPGLFVGSYLLRTLTITVPGSIVDAMFLKVTNETDYAQMFGVRIFGNNVGNAVGSVGGGALLGHHALESLLGLSGVLLLVAYTYLNVLLKKVHPGTDAHAPVSDGIAPSQ